MPRTGSSLIAGPGRRPSVHAHGPVALAVKLIAGHGAGGGRRGPRPGGRDAVDALGLYPGQARTWARVPGRPGTPALDHPAARPPSGGQAPGTSRQGRPAAVQLVGTVAARSARTLPGITLSDIGSQGERAHCRRSARQPGLPDGRLAARRTGCSASGHSRSQRPCQRFGSAGERAHSPRRAWLSLHRAVSGCGGPVSREDRASRPVQEALPRVPGSGRPALSGRRQGKSCSSAAGRVRPGAAGTSPPAISLAEHRVEFGVGPDRPDLLRAAAGDGDLGSPPQRLLA